MHTLGDPTPLLQRKLPGGGQGRQGDGRTDNCVKREEGEAKDSGGAKCGTGKSRTETPRWMGSTGTVLPTTATLGTQHGLISRVQPWSDSGLNNMSVHCVSGCLLPPKQWHSDLSVLHIGHRRSPTCCHTLPRRSLETQAHQLLPCCTRCGNMETNCVPV